MDKVSFIATLINQEKNNERWIRVFTFIDGTKHNDYWSYEKNGVDYISPELQLKNDGYVEYTNFYESDEPQILKYEEFLNNHILQ